MNIKLSYLYRDGANYKNHHEVVFSNSTNLPLDKIRTTIESALIDGQWFYADKWHLKDLHTHTWDNEIDHTWHEYDSVEETADEVTKGDILELMALVAS